MPFRCSVLFTGENENKTQCRFGETDDRETVKLTAVKTWLLTFLRMHALLVIAFIELIIAFLGLQLSKCKHRLQFGVWPKLQTKKQPISPQSKTNDCIYQADREAAIRQVLNCWSEKSNYTVAKDRRVFEATKWGQRAVRNNPDRHLYAVLRPTRQENLTRIGNVLREMDAVTFNRVLRNSEKYQCGKH